jgi:hypothetical protein
MRCSGSAFIDGSFAPQLQAEVLPPGQAEHFGTVPVVEVLALRALRPRRAGGPDACDVIGTFGFPAGRSARPDCSQREQFHQRAAT